MVPVHLITAALYLLVGGLLAIPFVLVGVGRIDPHARQAGWGFRTVIFPGTVFLWPLLARRWLRGDRQPPGERNAHRSAAVSMASDRSEPRSP